MAIVKANYQARKSGKAAIAMGKAAKYYQYREGADQPQRRWYDVTGQAIGYDQARKEIREQAQTWGYSYRIILSTAQADIGPAGYQQILAERFERAYFIEHHNTEHPHAHVICFTKKVLSRAQFKEMRVQLRELEQAKERELAQAAPIRQAQPPRQAERESATAGPTREAELARRAEPARRRQQDLERD